MVAIYGLFVLALSMFVLGLIVLAFFPKRLQTFGSLLLFVVGGFVGMGIAGFVIYLIFSFSGNRPLPLLGYLALPMSFIGAAAGGTALVRLKARFINEPEKSKV